MNEACLPEPPYIALQLPHQFLLVRELLPPKERPIPKHPHSSLLQLSSHVTLACACFEPHPLQRRASLELRIIPFPIPKLVSPHPRKQSQRNSNWIKLQVTSNRSRKLRLATSARDFVTEPVGVDSKNEEGL